jgi:hypothetical protein
MVSPDILRSSEASAESDIINTTGSATAVSINQQEIKKQRLQVLRDAHDCVRTIVNHMEKHYKNVTPPQWLDLRTIAGQLQRSAGKGASHAAWRSFRESLFNLKVWMDNHHSCKQRSEFFGPITAALPNSS